MQAQPKPGVDKLLGSREVGNKNFTVSWIGSR